MGERGVGILNSVIVHSRLCFFFYTILYLLFEYPLHRRMTHLNRLYDCLHTFFLDLKGTIKLSGFCVL